MFRRHFLPVIRLTIFNLFLIFYFNYFTGSLLSREKEETEVMLDK